MTDWRNELLKDMINAMYKVENMECSKLLVMARAALAVAEPVIREQADIALRAELAAVTERMSKLDFERTAAELERDALREENARLLKENSELMLRAHALLWLLPPEITCGELQKARDEMLAATIRYSGGREG